MKKYVKAQIIAKNLPTGSYVAGCPGLTNKASARTCGSSAAAGGYCSSCERSA